jgi:hypothetical protein
MINGWLMVITIWLFNIAMENSWNMDGLMGKIIYKWAIFHGYVKQPEGNYAWY